ncbi:MAG: DHH family phosphoesterase [Bacteroidales bacterium]
MKEIRYKESELLKSKIEKSKNILITTHVNSDGDAIGSTLAMQGILRKLSKNVNIVTPNDFPGFLQWMDGAKEILIYYHSKKKVRELAKKADLILCIDYNDSRRLENAEKTILDSTAFKILIDHHPEPGKFTDLVISDTSLGSSAEVIYYLLKDMGYVDLIDKSDAESLYTGVMTDTGNFSFACSYPEVWTMVAELLKKGLDKDKIYSLVYDNYSEKRMRLMGYCLNKKMKVFPELNTAVIGLTKEEMDKFDHVPGDTEGFVNLPFSIKGIKLTALFLEKKDHVRISMRSRGDFSVNMLSRKHFNGGGHLNAAGGELKMSVEEAIKNFREVISRYKEDLQ